MQLIINGKKTEIEHELTIAELVRQQSFNPECIIVEYNHRIIQRHEWQNIVLQPEDCLEVVTFVGGG